MFLMLAKLWSGVRSVWGPYPYDYHDKRQRFKNIPKKKYKKYGRRKK
jgi:hypothetical protein